MDYIETKDSRRHGMHFLLDDYFHILTYSTNFGGFDLVLELANNNTEIKYTLWELRY